MHTLDRSQLRGRYRITGDIVMDTALHIGGHGTSTITDSPIIRNGDNQPFIPGSSLKGRSARQSSESYRISRASVPVGWLTRTNLVLGNSVMKQKTGG